MTTVVTYALWFCITLVLTAVAMSAYAIGAVVEAFLLDTRRNARR